MSTWVERAYQDVRGYVESIDRVTHYYPPTTTKTATPGPALLAHGLQYAKGTRTAAPWSNAYHPPLPEDEEAPYYPPEALRDLEREANELWDIYLELYYGGSGGGEVVGSVYLWDQGSGGDGGGGNGEFAGCFAVKKRE